MYDLIIIGGGPAGLTAGIYGGRAGLKTLLIEKTMPGGQAANTHLIENYPGFPEGIGGWELMQKFSEQAQKWDTEIITDDVTSLARDNGVSAVICGENRYEAGAVIIAAGAAPKHLGVKGEETLIGGGVSYCGTCDGPLYRGKEIAVVGGGNTALQEIDFLSRFVDKIHLIHRRDTFRAQKPLIEKAKVNQKVVTHLNAEVEEIFGEGKVEGLRVVSQGQKTTITADGVFIFVGHNPNTEFCKDFLETDAKGFIKVNAAKATSREGFFAAGDVVSKDFFQVATAVGDGAEAVHSVEMWLQKQ